MTDLQGVAKNNQSIVVSVKCKVVNDKWVLCLKWKSKIDFDFEYYIFSCTNFFVNATTMLSVVIAILWVLNVEKCLPCNYKVAN